MSKTENFQLDYLRPRQLTSQDVLMDQRRMTAIDNNLYALFNIFGNGILVLSATEFPLYIRVFVDSNATKKIQITPGRAFVNFQSIHYTTTTELSLPSQTGTVTTQKLFLYLKSTNDTVQTELGEFVFSSDPLPSSSSYIGLGAVQINYSTGTTQFFDDSANGRQIINVKKLFLSFINSHAHTGGLGNPKKIDLGTETTGYISPESVSMVNASLIRNGQLSQFVSPQVDHSSLRNTGNLSHSQLDAAVLSYRQDLNMETVASVNQLKLIGNVMRTTTEATSFTGSAAYPSGSVALVDSGMVNVFMYCPNITSDGVVVGYNGPTGTNMPNGATNATGPKYAYTLSSRMANIDRTNKYVCIGTVPMSSSNVQKVFTLQPIVPQRLIERYGQSGYFGGFVPGLRYFGNSGSAHLIYYLQGSSGSGTNPYESFEKYDLAVPDKYNSTLGYGFSGVQMAALLTNLPDFTPTNVFCDGTYAHLLYSASFTGPRVLSIYNNGYISTTTPSALFANTGPLGPVRSFYYNSSTGPKAALFNDGTIIANMGGADYKYTSLGNGKLDYLSAKVVLSEFSSTSLNLTELGTTGPISSLNIVSNATNITMSAVSTYQDTSSYRVFYFDNDRLHVVDPTSNTELGYFTGVVDMVVRNNKLFILTSENNAQKMYYAYEAGIPTVFNKVALNTSSPTGSKIDAFVYGTNSVPFEAIVSGNNYYLFTLNGKQVMQYTPGDSKGSGPEISMMYLQADLGDATVDLKYG